MGNTNCEGTQVDTGWCEGKKLLKKEEIWIGEREKEKSNRAATQRDESKATKSQQDAEPIKIQTQPATSGTLKNTRN